MKHFENDEIFTKVGFTKIEISQKALKTGGYFFDMLDIKDASNMAQNFMWWECGAFEL
jgi:hypothetical protein